MAIKALKSILYVEDEPDIQAIARIALEEVGGFTLCVCANGNEALVAVDSFDPDLLLLDVMMPEMDGPTTLKELRKLPKTSKTPAVFMTAKVQPQEVEAFKAMGAQEVIAKPFDPMTLSEEISQIWKQSLG